MTKASLIMTLLAFVVADGCALAADRGDPSAPIPSQETQFAIMPAPCTIAAIGVDGGVVVGWSCVDEADARFRGGDVDDAFAHVMKAIRDGAAVSMPGASITTTPPTEENEK